MWAGITMWAGQGPMSRSCIPELHDHRHRIRMWATGGGHGGVAGSVAAVDTATSNEVLRVTHRVFRVYGKGFDTGPPQIGAGSLSFRVFSPFLVVVLGLAAGFPARRINR